MTPIWGRIVRHVIGLALVFVVITTVFAGLDWFSATDFVTKSNTDASLRRTLATPTQSKEDSTLQSHSGDASLIRILSWTWRFSFKKDWFQSTGKSLFDKCGLGPDMRCEYTTDLTDYNISDVILFKGRRLKDQTSFPTFRSPNQKWVFHESEPPPLMWEVLPNLNSSLLQNVFNLTSTYSMDSDIPIRLRMKCSLDEESYDNMQDYDVASKKTRLIAWFVSHCQTPSRREEFVKVLQKYLPVDIYGDCGTLKCGEQTMAKNESNYECDDMLLNSTYKFYLSFENSLCKDYVTEKAWKILMRPVDIIPVVMGWEDYSQLAPPSTFIDVRDFQSVEQLAKYLLRLHKDEALYNEYIRRKRSLKCDSVRRLPYECRLCQYLHANKKRRQLAANVVDYWSEANQCQTLEEFLSEGYKRSIESRPTDW